MSEPDDTPGHSVFSRLGTYRELATADRLPLGILVAVEHTGEFFIAGGTTSQKIRTALGWEQPNIWIPLSAFGRFEEAHPEIGSPLDAFTTVVNHPDSIHDVAAAEHQTQFFASANVLRDRGWTLSRKIKYVDVLIESRRVVGGVYLRAFHLAPARRTKGKQLWP